MQQWLLVGAGTVVGISALLAAMGYRGRQQVVGIDLGTTFSVVAIKGSEQITVLPDHISGKVLVPSVVTFHPNGSTLVGSRAVELRGDLPQNTIFNAKRFIGRQFLDATADAAAHPFNVTADPNGTAENASAGFWIPGGSGRDDHWVSPIEVGGQVVNHIKQSITKSMGYTISKAVICVPAKFSSEQRKATTKAFEAGGFKVLRVLEEPTAAAVAYNLHKGSGTRYVLVYDIGGGTLDTSLLYMNGKAVNVLGVAGDDHLGGSDFDLRTRDLLLRKLPTAEVVQDVPHLPCDSTGLLILGEQAKIELTKVLDTTVRCLGEDGRGRLMTVTRKEFEAAAQDLFDKSMDPVARVLEDQMMTREDLDDVVLVGGASRTPRIRELLQEFVGPGKKLHTEIDPDITVAFGAANIID